MSIRVISRIRDAFQTELPVRSFFETPTVASMSVAIVQLIEDTERMLAELEALSDEEARLLLAKEE